MHDAMRDHADFSRSGNGTRLLGGEFADHRFEGFGEGAFRQIALCLALRSAMHEPRAVNADAFHQSARVAGLVRSVIETVFERRRTAVDDEDLPRPFALEFGAVSVGALGTCR